MRRALPAALLTLLAVAPAAWAVPGDLDEGFGTGGLVRSSSVAALEAAPDGSLVLVGNSGQTEQSYVQRLLPSGAVDPAFGANGTQWSVLGTGYSFGRALDLRGDGGIVVGGTTSPSPDPGDFVIGELGPDGSFPCGAPSCAISTDFEGRQDRLFDVFAEASGGTLAAGVSSAGPSEDPRLAVARYLPSGELDASFSGDGKLLLDTGGARGFAEQAAVSALADGSVLLAGAGPGPDGTGAGDVLVAKLEPDGDLDPGFGGGDGWATVDVDSRDDATQVEVAGDGSIVVGIRACAFGLHTTCRAAIARFTPAGEPDPTFGEAGVVRGAPGTSFAVAGDSVYVAGESGRREHFGSDFAVVRLTRDGSVDGAFGGDGVATADFDLSSDTAEAIALAAPARVVAAGRVDTGSEGYGLAAFELGDGPPDMDGDLTLDSADRCPERYSSHATGCPREPRGHRVRAAGKWLKGRVSAAVDACAEDVRVRIHRARDGRDPRVGRERTNEEGRWRLRASRLEGRFYAVAKPGLAPGLARCPRAESKRVRA